MRYCVYDYPKTQIIPDSHMLVTIPMWNYAKLDRTSADSGVGVHFVPSRAESPALAATTPTLRAGAKRSYCTVDCVAELIGTDSLMHIVPDVWAHRTDSLRESSLT